MQSIQDKTTTKDRVNNSLQALFKCIGKTRSSPPRCLVIFLILSTTCDHSLASVQVSQQEHPKPEQIAPDKIEQIQIPKDQIPLVRLPSNTLLKYTAYKDVSILHFRIPPDTRTALFTFKAYEESNSAFQRFCEPHDITLHLKAGSYPVISPENITFPKHFLSADQRFEIYNLRFKSNGSTQKLTIDGPQAGNWFAVAFITWTDPKSERIEQQGLAASCETLLLSEMSVARIVPVIINSGRGHTVTLASDADQNGTNVISFKFFVPRNVGVVTVRIAVDMPCSSCPPIEFYVEANALPGQGDEHNLYAGVVYPNQTGETVFDDVVVQSSQWHFIDIGLQDKGPRTSTKESKSFQLGSSSASLVDEHLADNRTLQEVDISFQVDFHVEDEEVAAASEAVDPKRPVVFRGIEYHPLLRQTYREFFMFDYDLLPDVNGSVPTHLNITAGTPIGFRFDVGDVYDIGGTLSFAVAIKPDIKENGDTDSTSNDETSGSGQTDGQDDEDKLKGNQTIVVCMHLGEPGEPLWPDSCRYGKHTLPASSVVNNSDIDTSTGLIHVPFPESGKWYITMGLFCHGAATTARVTIIDSVKDFIRKYTTLLETMRSPCSCVQRSRYYKACIEDRKCLAQMNETETLKIKECLMDSKCTANYEDMTKKFEIHHRFATEQSVATDDSCNSSVVFTISSSPCVAGRCGRYGRCYHYMSGGFVFSTCLCNKGYRGWDCTEDSQVPSSISILIASLLLTLSNLVFIPSIYFAIHRKYYTEAVIYFCAMFFSIFYHACDSGEDEYSFCLVKIGVLQFCDFYCGLLAIWVTLIAMAHIRQQFVSLLHMLGAIVLAFGTELNKQSLWVFLAPALTGICLISVSWGMKCRKTRKWFPSRKYLTIFMPIGAVLVMVGLVCYAFLQTKQNYHIVHSVWHMVMALAILCLLPSRKTFLPKC